MRHGLRLVLVALLALVAAGCQTTSLQNQLRWYRTERERLSAEINKLEHDLNACHGQRDGFSQRYADLLAQLEASRRAESDLQRALADAQARPVPSAFTQSEEQAFEGLPGVAVARGDQGEIRLTLDQAILFPSGSSVITSEGQQTLGRITPILKQRFSGRRVRVEGHTDDVPVARVKDRYPSNWELSSARAAAVLRNLLSSGALAPELGHVAGYADQQPVAPNDSDSGRKRNRRVEIWIMPG